MTSKKEGNNNVQFTMQNFIFQYKMEDDDICSDSIIEQATFSQILQRMKPYSYAKYVRKTSQLMHDLIQLKINGLSETVCDSTDDHDHDCCMYALVVNTGLLLDSLENFCQVKLQQDPFWPIPMQCCLLARYIAEFVESRGITSLKIKASQHKEWKMHLWQQVISIYLKYYQKHDYPRFYATLLHKYNVSQSEDISRQCLILCKQRLSTNHHHLTRKKEIRAALDSWTHLVINPIYDYGISCADYFEFRIQRIHTKHGLGPLEPCSIKYIYQFFNDLFLNESQFEVSTGYIKYNHDYNHLGDWEYDHASWWLIQIIGKCCLHLFVKFALLVDMIKFYNNHNDHDKKIPKKIQKEILQLTSKNKEYSNKLQKYLCKFAVAYVKLYKFIGKNFLSDENQSLNLGNSISYPTTSMKTIDSLMSSLQKTIQSCFVLLSYQYLIDQNNQLETILNCAKMMDRYHWYYKHKDNINHIHLNEEGFLVAGDCEHGMLINFCLYFILGKWEMCQEFLDVIVESHGDKYYLYYIFKLCYGLYLTLIEKPNPFGEHCHHYYNFECKCVENSKLTMKQRWDLVIEKVTIGRLGMLTDVTDIESTLCCPESRTLIQTFLDDNHDYDDDNDSSCLIQFCNNLCQLKQCHWNQCKKKSKKLKKCKNCRQVLYCSRLCQKKHWANGHSDVCKQYTISQ